MPEHTEMTQVTITRGKTTPGTTAGSFSPHAHDEQSGDVSLATPAPTRPKSTWLNQWEVEDACDQYTDNPTLGPATLTLRNLMRVVNQNSDGWAYWQKPQRASGKLQALIEYKPDGSPRRSWEDNGDVTVAELKAAYSPIKSFLTRNGLTCDIVLPGA